ncbi:DNA/RNA non-specific endonuclease [Arcobacter roscoffensis]|uniref:DNA/RNA non-specific endonuclease n=1 Tax=Arcobacter roscoffensis TaxID=2961520 RepID=A0ABY5E397_9BACT|nr:DNA/RNA non-specific endonuclease [Arcobacter roscoffensis]
MLPYNNAGKEKDEKQDINKMTNIAPQNRGLNTGCWRVKEINLLKDFEKNKKDIVITVGISFPKDEKNLEKVGNLNYPKSFFMLI